MAGKLQHELGKRTPFACPEEEAFLGLIRTADVLGRAAGEMFKTHDLSSTQYSVLRILRGTCPAGTSGLACSTIADQMLTRDPDMTRLLDRLEKHGLISRAREEKDRRVVRTCITEKGLSVLAELDPFIAECHRKQLGHLGESRLRQLIDLLEAARDKP